MIEDEHLFEKTNCLGYSSCKPMKHVPAFLLGCIFWSGCVTGNRIDSKPDDPEAEKTSMKKDETIVLLSGQGRTRLSMVILSNRFSSAGYQTLHFPYNQTFDSLDEISGQLIDFIRRKVKTSNYHLIGHSLGNVIIRNAFGAVSSRTANLSISTPPAIATQPTPTTALAGTSTSFSVLVSRNILSSKLFPSLAVVLFVNQVSM